MPRLDGFDCRRRPARPHLDGFSMTLTRREFIGAGAMGAATLVLPRSAGASTPLERGDVARASVGGAARPVAIASNNGLRGVKVAYDRIVSGTDPLDAAIAGVNIQELDPQDQSVGVGGLPTAEGWVGASASGM